MLASACSPAYISVNRCQASLQKTIGEPLQAREAATMQASLTVITERLRALEERTYSKLDALTAVECSFMFSHRRKHRIVRSVCSSSKHKTSCRSRSKNSFPAPKPSRAESSSYLRRFTRFSNPCHSISTSRAAPSWRRCSKAAGVGASTTVQVDRSHPLCLPAVRLRRTQSHRQRQGKEEGLALIPCTLSQTTRPVGAISMRTNPSQLGRVTPSTCLRGNLGKPRPWLSALKEMALSPPYKPQAAGRVAMRLCLAII